MDYEKIKMKAWSELESQLCDDDGIRGETYLCFAMRTDLHNFVRSRVMWHLSDGKKVNYKIWRKQQGSG